MVADIRPKTAGCGKQECIRVIVRCRPLSAKEIAENHPSIVSCHPQRGVIELKTSPNSSELSKDFTFDAVYNESSKQTDLYDESFRDLVDSVLNGFNGTIFAYGQTGTGKTYTMEGKPTPSEKGVIYNCIDHIFDHIANSKNQQFLVRASYMEIYKEEIRDLLSKDLNARLELKERADSGVYVKGLSTFMTRSADEIQKVMSVGNANRSVGPTNMNEHSSRSHAIFTITVECSDIDMTGESHIRVGKLNLVDLAGSERQAKTGATGERFKEATKINLSLSALGNVISALVDGKSSHIPYRDSKLTRLLQDSLGGNSKTVMVACIGPASYNYEETLGTLRYANRAKNIKNKPKINEDPKDALLREFQDEIIRLRSMLEKRKGKKDGHERGEDYFRNEQYTLEMDRDRVMKDESLVQEERLRIVETIEERERMLQNEKQNQAKVLERIKTMESKLLGGVDLIDQTREQQMELERRRLELAEQKRREREVLQQLEKQEEDTVEIHQTFANLQQEVEAKSKKLMKFKMKLKKIRSEMQDASILHSQERRDLERDVSEINKELKLKLLIVDNFIPLNIRERIKERAIWSEEESNWSCPGARPLSADSHPVVENILLGDDQGVLTRSIGADSGVSCEAGPSKSNDLFEKRPLSNPGLRRPVSSHEVELVKRAQRHLTKLERPPMEALQGPQPILNEEILRFCGENVLVFSGLERIQDNVKEYDESEINPSSHRQKDITIDATPSVRTRLRSPSITGLNRSRSKNEPARSALGQASLYPKARGLVGK